jgi:DegV family protein with EDD domain
MTSLPLKARRYLVLKRIHNFSLFVMEAFMVKIITDTTSGLPKELASQLGIPVIPQTVIFGEKAYRDDTELDTLTFLKLLKGSKQLPKTAAPSPELYKPFFQLAKDNGESVIVIAPSEKVSGTVNSAMIARKDYPDTDIRVIDAMTIAGNLGTLALLAHQLAKEGKTADEIESFIKDLIPRGRTYFLINTLEYLQKGGRIGGARALLGELLQVKPILQIKDGQVAPFDQERTKKRALGKLIEIVTEQVKASKDPHLCVMHVEALEDANALAATFATNLNISNIPFYELPPAIVVHAGPKTLAVGFFS